MNEEPKLPVALVPADVMVALDRGFLVLPQPKMRAA
jgi:hypothetical protein